MLIEASFSGQWTRARRLSSFETVSVSASERMPRVTRRSSSNEKRDRLCFQQVDSEAVASIQSGTFVHRFDNSFNQVEKIRIANRKTDRKADGGAMLKRLGGRES